MATFYKLDVIRFGHLLCTDGEILSIYKKHPSAKAWITGPRQLGMG
ncbi:MAG: hypothetical protein ACE10H_12110 [Candidatus Binatia bacterium]